MSVGRAVFVLSASVGIFLSACGRVTTGAISVSDTVCPSGVVQILVGDGFLKRLCGCAEASDTLVPLGTSLGCTINHGTKVFFYYTGSMQRHQIASTGSPSFPDSPISEFTPKKKRPPVIHFVQFDTVGTYLFQDKFESNAFGQFNVL